jgi:hypothetical protein
MKPYSRRNLTAEEQIANYRISRARRTSENAFGMLANVFRAFHTPIYLQPSKAAKVVLACCALHNYLRSGSNGCGSTAEDCTRDEEISSNLFSLKVKQTNFSQAAKDTREHLKVYFSSVGRFEWQDKQSSAFQAKFIHAFDSDRSVAV